MSAGAIYSLYAAFVLGGVGLYFMLPNPDRGRPVAGALLGILGWSALALVCVLTASGGAGAAFYVLASVAVASTTRVITHPKPVYCALYFVLTVLSVASLCLLQRAEFLAAAIIIIYAGAILVTYVFVIMLAQQGGPSAADRRSREPFLSIVAGFLTMAVLTAHAAQAVSKVDVGAPAAHVRQGGATTLASSAAPGDESSAAPQRDEQGSARSDSSSHVASIGGAVMTRYMVALQLSGLLLLIAMVGAVAMSRKRVAPEGCGATRALLGQTGREAAPF